MTIRQLQKEDQLQCTKIQSIAFEFPFDLKVDENSFTEGLCWGAFDDDGTLFAEMYVLHHEMYFGGKVYKSSGIAGVATMPEHRHKKGIREIFAAVFQKMRADGEIFSMLYPFKYAYYNKFGYETVYRKLNLSFDFDLFSDIPRNNSCRLIETRSCDDIRKVYEQYACSHNCALKRGDDQWNRRLPENVYGEKKYTYVYYRADGTPGGYFVFVPQNGDGGKVMKMTDFFYLTKEDLYGILGFIRNYEADYRKVEIDNIPYDEDFSVMFTNQYNVHRTVSYSAMARVADVEKVLTAMPYPDGGGTFSIKVDDDFLEYNCGIYDVAYLGGKAEVTRRSKGDADIEVNERAFARLVLGTDSLASHHMKFAQGIKINRNMETLSKVFIKREIFLGDYF